MAVQTERPWRIVFRGTLTEPTFRRLAQLGITRCGPAFTSRTGRGEVSHPLRILARDADDAFNRLAEALDGRSGRVYESPVPID